MADETPKEEKTEEATQKRRDEAREKGQVAMSQDFVSAFMLFAALLAFYLSGQQLFLGTAAVTTGIVGRLDAWALNDIGTQEAAQLAGNAWWEIAPRIGVVLLPTMAVGLVVSYLQSGFKLTPKALELDIKKLDPIKGTQKIVGARGFMRFGQSGLKLVVLTAVAVTATVLKFHELAALAHMELTQALYHGGRFIISVALYAVVAIIAISLIDLLYQRFQHSKDLRMSKNEIKQEMKNSQGDPQVKQRIRAVQREMSARRMMEDVPNATVVVTNPTHFAVALYYEKGPDGEPLVAAPKVVAKGVDALARKIKEVAAENDVILYEDVPLARALYARCEIGDLVPVELFEAVAAVIRYVYGLREGQKVSA